MNIIQMLQLQAMRRPTAAAIIEPAGRLKDRIATFASLEESSARGAAFLKECGLRSGDVVLVFQPMSIDLYILLLALFRGGMIAMFLDPSAGLKHLETCCSILPPQGFVGPPKAHLLRLASPALRSIPLHLVIGRSLPGARSWKNAEDFAPLREDPPDSPHAPALITFTSGSTGAPKGVVRSHGFLREQHRILEQTLAMNAGDRDLTTLPVFVLANLASGVTSIIPDADLRRPGFIDAAPVLRQINRLGPVRTVASPAFLECLCIAQFRKGGPVHGFRQVFTGGAPVFPQTLQRFAHIFENADIIAVYGSTEAEPIATIRWADVTAQDKGKMVSGAGLLAGIPVPGLRVGILDNRRIVARGVWKSAQFSDFLLPAGETGEIIVTGEHVLKSYLHGHGDSETKILMDGDVWHRTGDSGYFDQRGRLWLMGRTSAVIQDHRGTLHPFAVECAATQYPGVCRSALLQHSGKRLLLVQPRDAAGCVSLKGLSETLSWAGIDEVRCLKRIPCDKRHNAKVDYPALIRMVEKHRR